MSSIFSQEGESFDYTYLSLGAGTQSSAMLILACQGKVPRPEAVIFADTGDEPHWVYDYLGYMTEFAKPYGIHVHVTSKGRLSEWMIDRQRQGKRFVSVPVYTAGVNGSKEGMLRRQCTREFKVEPITKKVRELLDYQPRQRVKERVRCFIGISLDESRRMKPSRERWITNRFPLVEMGITRSKCRQILLDAGLPEPRKSACVFCPYHSDNYWNALKTQAPEEFAKAVEFDNGIRDMTMRGRKQPGYVHRSCKPLIEVDFDPNANQVDMFENECEGMCGL